MSHPGYLRLVVTALAVMLAGCASSLPLPDGTYANAQGAGTLIVKGDRVEVRIPAEGRSPYEYGILGYDLYRDGTIRFMGSSNSSYYLFVVIDYQWRWTGTAIERKDQRDGRLVTYAPVP